MTTTSLGGIVRGGGVLTTAVAATLVGESVWTVKRPLPTPAGLDASGTVAGSCEDCRSLRVVALGDSTLTGPGLDESKDVWLRSALGQLSHHRSIELVSLAVGGSRVADVAGRVHEALDLEPDLVVLSVGANDALRCASSKTVRIALHHIVGRLLDIVHVVAVTNIGDLGNIPRVPPPLTALVRARAGATQSAIEAVVDQHERAVLLDVTGADRVLRNRTVFTHDLFHPGAVGHAAWAASVLPGLRDAIDRAERVGRGCGLRTNTGASPTTTSS